MMLRGEVWWVNFDPSVGGEIKKKRPAIIISALSLSSSILPQSSQRAPRKALFSPCSLWQKLLRKRMIAQVRDIAIISNNAANKFMNRIQVIPLTSNVSNLYPSEAFVTVKGKKSKAMTDQIATVSKLRVFEKYANLASKDLMEVERALCVHLGITTIG